MRTIPSYFRFAGERAQGFGRHILVESNHHTLSGAMPPRKTPPTLAATGPEGTGDPRGELKALVASMSDNELAQLSAKRHSGTAGSIIAAELAKRSGGSR